MGLAGGRESEANVSENQEDQSEKPDAAQQWLKDHPRANLAIGWSVVLLVAASVVGIVVALAGSDDQESDRPASSQQTKRPTPSPTIDVAALRNELVAKAEAAVLAELPDAPIWEGLTVTGRYVSDTEVCVDRTYPRGGGIDDKGGSAGYVVVTFPGTDLGEPQDGKCATADAEPEPNAEPVDVPAAFKDDPGLVTRDDLGDDWPLTVDFGAVDCRTTVIDGVTLQSVTFRVPNMQYALNGTAKTHSPFPDIDPIWADDPDVAGLKIGIGPLIERGLARCG